jgi:putative transposase
MVHLIFVCKYRKKLLNRFGDDIKQILYDIANEHDFGIVEMEVDKDHIHLLIEYNPTQSLLELVRLLKQISTYRIWRKGKNSYYLQKCF